MHTRRRLWCTDLLREDAPPTESLSSHERRNDILLLETCLGLLVIAAVIAEGRGSKWSFSTPLPHHSLCLSGTKEPEMKGSKERDTCKSLISCFHSKSDAPCFILGPDQYREKITDWFLALNSPDSQIWHVTEASKWLRCLWYWQASHLWFPWGDRERNTVSCAPALLSCCQTRLNQLQKLSRGVCLLRAEELWVESFSFRVWGFFLLCHFLFL